MSSAAATIQFTAARKGYLEKYYVLAAPRRRSS